MSNSIQGKVTTGHLRVYPMLQKLFLIVEYIKPLLASLKPLDLRLQVEELP